MLLKKLWILKYHSTVPGVTVYVIIEIGEDTSNMLWNYRHGSSLLWKTKQFQNMIMASFISRHIKWHLHFKAGWNVYVIIPQPVCCTVMCVRMMPPANNVKRITAGTRRLENASVSWMGLPSIRKTTLKCIRNFFSWMIYSFTEGFLICTSDGEWRNCMYRQKH